jgi:hypothetical protein
MAGDLQPIRPGPPILPRLIAVHILTMVGFVLFATIAPFPVVFGVILVAIIGVPVGCAVATTYLVVLYLNDPARPRSELFAFLAYGGIVITLGLGLVALVALFRVASEFLHTPLLSNELTTTLVGLGLLLCAAVPIMKGALFYGINRRDPSNPRPPMRGGE